jgi:creatinine amidohydrolase/Fe(II)-dependent formamide hydrolase-like protein
MAETNSFRLEVLGRYQARLPGNENAVTANLAAGDEHGHVVYAGTITLSESQFRTLVEALRSSLGDRFEVDEFH